MKKYIVILADGKLERVFSKTESALIRYSRDPILGIIDSFNAGKTVEDVLGFGGDIPITGTLDELFHLNPNYLFIGTSVYGGTFEMEWYPMIIKAIQSKLNIINGLHQSLMDIAEFNLLAKKYRTKIIDLRQNEDKYTKFRGLTKSLKSKKVLVSGTNDYAGKLTTTIEVVKGLHKDGVATDWLPTSMAGTHIKRKGQIVESISADQVSGFIEYELYELDEKFEFLFIEGRGGLMNPVFSTAMMGIYHGASPNGMILCHRAEDSGNLNTIIRNIDFYQNLMDRNRGSAIIAISLNTALIENDKAAALIDQLEEKLSLPVTDPVRFNPGKLVDAVKAFF